MTDKYKNFDDMKVCPTKDNLLLIRIYLLTQSTPNDQELGSKIRKLLK